MSNMPKILVITVPAWNSKVGSNTWASLLGEFPSENIANINIRPEPSDNPVCGRYFCISESAVIKSIYKKNIKTGNENTVSSLRPQEIQVHHKRYARMKRSRSYALLLAREIVWKLGNWKTKELDSFLDDFKPDIILHSMEGYIHLNRIVEYCIKRTGAKAIGYIWDDNFTYKQHSNLGYYIYRYFQRGSLKSLAKQTVSFFAITEKTKKEADSFFGINCTVLTKPLSSLPVVEEKELHFPIRILYTGNLYIGRDRSLSLLRQCIELLNQKGNFFQVDVYTNSLLSDRYLAQNCTEACRIHPPIPQSEVLALQKQADILLFLEDIDGPDAKVARLSFSTKLTDYLSAGKCILAIGNKETAPMEYLSKNHAAIVAESLHEVEQRLHDILENPTTMQQTAQKAAKLAIENHHPDKITRIFKEVVAATVAECE